MDPKKPRDPELIRKDILIADLMASNCALQGEGMLLRGELLSLRLERVKAHQDRHDREKAMFEAELKEAEAALAATPPALHVVGEPAA